MNGRTSKCSASERFSCLLLPIIPVTFAASARSLLYLYEAYTCAALYMRGGLYAVTPRSSGQVKGMESRQLHLNSIMVCLGTRFFQDEY